MEDNVQRTALYYKQNLIADIPQEYIIDPCFLQLYSEQDLKCGIQDYRIFLEHVFEFFMDDSEYDNKDLNSILQLLFIIGRFGNWCNDTITLVREDYVSQLKKSKITRTEKYFMILKALGFGLSGLNPENIKFSSKDFDTVTLIYEKAPKVLAALNAFGNTCQKMKLERTMFHCDYRVFQNSKLKQPKADLEDCIGSLSDENKNFLRDLHQYLTANGYKLDVHDQIFKGTYLHKKTRYPIVVFYIEQGKFDLRINGDSIKEYDEFISGLPMNILESCISGKDCDDCCPTCRKGYEITVSRKNYKKCRAYNFMFEVKEDNRELLRKFIENECNARQLAG